MLLRINWLVIVGLLFISCSEDKKETNQLVKIGESVLTEEDVNNALGEFRNQSRLREEYINNWIEKELLFKEALKEGLLDSPEYKTLIEKNSREIAASLLISEYLKENSYEPSADELLEFYEKTKDDFLLSDDTYLFNIVDFGNFESAVKFRKILVESDWKKAINQFRGDPVMIKAESDVLMPLHKIGPVAKYKIVSNLLPGEISIILQTEPDKFTVVQLIDKYGKGLIPPYEIIEDQIKDRFLLLKNKEIIREYINKLIEDHDIDLKGNQE